MPKVAEKSALHPKYLESCRGFALMAIIEGLSDADVEYLPAESAEHITDEIAALRARGVGPKRAEVLLKRLNDGREFRVIDGGGEVSQTASRAALRLLAGAL